MEENIQTESRKGIHKHFHVTRWDTFGYAILSLGFFVLLIFKVMNRILEWGVATPYISWIDTMQLAVLWAILGFVSHTYYLKHERKYDK